MNAIRNFTKQSDGTGSSPRRGRVTINDLAQRLGMSKSTVSRALNGYPDISEATRLRVSNMAKKIGYQPLSHAQAIRTGRVRALALVLQTDEPDRHNPFLQDFLLGACETASAHGWTVPIAPPTPDADPPPGLARLRPVPPAWLLARVPAGRAVLRARRRNRTDSAVIQLKTVVKLNSLGRNISC